MTITSELNRIFQSVTARERATLILRAWKNKIPEDPLWRQAMPPDQREEFNRLISLMNVANGQLSHLITFIALEVDKLEMKVMLWYCLRLWDLHISQLDFAASNVATEVVTESELAARQATRVEEYVPVDEVARTLALERRDWGAEDLYVPQCANDAVIKPEVWEVLCERAEADLRGAVKSGELVSKGGGKSLRIRRDSFEAWFQQPMEEYPDWAAYFRVVPDAELEKARSARRSLATLRNLLDSTPLEEHSPEAHTLAETIEVLEQSATTSLRVRWQEIRAAEILVGEVAANFAGEDPLKPFNRARLDEARKKLEWLSPQLHVYLKDLTLEEPSPEDVDALRTVISSWL